VGGGSAIECRQSRFRHPDLVVDPATSGQVTFVPPYTLHLNCRTQIRLSSRRWPERSLSGFRPSPERRCWCPGMFSRVNSGMTHVSTGEATNNRWTQPLCRLQGVGCPELYDVLEMGGTTTIDRALGAVPDSRTV